MTSERKKENVVRLHRERQRDRETDTQRDRQTERQRNRTTSERTKKKKICTGNPSLEIC